MTLTDWPARVLALRRALDVTQAELAEKIGCVPHLITRWEHGVHVPSRRCRRKLEALEAKAKAVILETEANR